MAEGAFYPLQSSGSGGGDTITSPNLTITVGGTTTATTLDINLANANVYTGRQSGAITANLLATGAVDGTTITLSSGAATLGLGHSNTWTVAQIFTTIINQGGYHSNVTVVSTTPYSMVGTDEVILVTTGGSAITVNLQSVAGTAKGRKLIVIQTDGVGSVVIAVNGSDTIEGSSSKTISAQYGKVGLVSDGVSTWYDLGTGGGI
jgi:hypothetical protein